MSSSFVETCQQGLRAGGLEESVIHPLELSELGNLPWMFEVGFFAESPLEQCRVLELSKLEYGKDGFLNWKGRITTEAEAWPPRGHPELRYLGVNIWHHLYLININGVVVSTIQTKYPKVWSPKLMSQLRKVIFFNEKASYYKLQWLLITHYKERKCTIKLIHCENSFIS